MSDTFEKAQRPVDGIWGTVDGVPITDEVIANLVQDTEAGFPSSTFRPVGRPRTVGRRAAQTVTVRLDQERIRAVQACADREHTTASEIMRRAIDRYLAG